MTRKYTGDFHKNLCHQKFDFSRNSVLLKNRWCVIKYESYQRMIQRRLKAFKGPWSQVNWKWFRSDMNLNNRENHWNQKTSKTRKSLSDSNRYWQIRGRSLLSQSDSRSAKLKLCLKKRDNHYANLGPRSHGRVYN